VLEIFLANAGSKQEKKKQLSTKTISLLLVTLTPTENKNPLHQETEISDI
jgi:hypothetical protein